MHTWLIILVRTNFRAVLTWQHTKRTCHVYLCIIWTKVIVIRTCPLYLKLGEHAIANVLEADKTRTGPVYSVLVRYASSCVL